MARGLRPPKGVTRPPGTFRKDEQTRQAGAGLDETESFETQEPVLRTEKIPPG